MSLPDLSGEARADAHPRRPSVYACTTDGLTCQLITHSQHDGAVSQLEEAVGVLGLQELVL